MKLIAKAVLLISCLFTLVSCEIDNYDKPNSTFFGGIKDSITGELVEQDIRNGSVIRATELGFETPAEQVWVIKNNGEFMNNLVFAGKYDFRFENGNFFPFTVENFEIKPGDNKHDFVVTPYIRIKNLTIKHDATNKKIVAQFNLEGGKPGMTVEAIRLYSFTDIYVGDAIKFATAGTGYRQTFSPAKVIDNSVYTLSIDLTKNTKDFEFSRNYYFRVGALAGINGVGTVRYNYGQLVKIPLEF